MSKLGGVKRYVQNVFKSAGEILLEWIKETSLVEIVGDEIVSAKEAMANREKTTPKESIKRLTKKQINSFLDKYEEENGVRLDDEIKTSFKNTIKSLKTGNLNIKGTDAVDDFYEDDDIRALFAELDIAYESSDFIEGGIKRMKLNELKNENLKKLKIIANGESLDIQGPIPLVNDEIVAIKNNIVELDRSSSLNDDIDEAYISEIDRQTDDLKTSIFNLMSKTDGVKDLKESYKNAFTNALVALMSVKSNFDLNIADRPVDDVLNNTNKLGQEIKDKLEDDTERIDEIENTTKTDVDSLVFNPVIETTANLSAAVPAAEDGVMGIASIATVATLLIAIPINLAIQKRNVAKEGKYKSNFTFKQPLIASTQISSDFISKYAKAIEVKSLIEAKGLIESSIATADGGSVVSRAARNKMLTPANINPKDVKLFKQAPINYDELMATFSEATPYLNKLNTDSLFLAPSLTSVVRRNLETYNIIMDLKVPEGSGESSAFLSTGRNAHPTYLDIEISYKDFTDLTKLGGRTNTKKSTLGFHVTPRILKSSDILTTVKEMSDFEDVKVLNGERESQKKLSNVIKFWKKKGTSTEKAVLSSNSFSAIVDKIENIKNPLFHLVLSYSEYMDLKENSKIDLMNDVTYKKIVSTMPIISISIVDEERDIVYLSEGPYMNYVKHDGSDFIDSISQYEKDLKTIIKYNQYQ